MKRFRQPYHPEEEGIQGIMPWSIQRLSEQGKQAMEAGVVVEEPLEIRLQGRPVAVLMRTPGLEKELATGFCLGEGLVADLMDIALVRHCGRALPDETVEGDPLDESRNRVDVRLIRDTAGKTHQAHVVQMIRSGCGRSDARVLTENLAPVNTDLRVRVQALNRLLGQLTRQQSAYRAAGGIHAAGVFDANCRPIVVCEDIGRHNAVDKATGYCLLRGISLRDKLLVSTGRASYDMVAKGVRLGIPVLASISSPTSLAVELADTLNCTLLGYLRGKTLNVYTHGWRIIGAQGASNDG